MSRIAHISDIHFGRIAHPRIVPDLIAEVNAGGVDVVVLSGDLTQRARHREFQAAVEMIEAFEPPVIVVPGNHDVHPWWRPASRLLRPLSRYQHYVSDSLMPTFENEHLAILGINSAHGRTVKGGLVGREMRWRIAEFFGEQPAERFKVLVVHHHLTRIQALGPHDVARKARRTLEVAAEVGVSLVLCGHLHISHIEPVLWGAREHRLVVASAGTATSNRGRGEHRMTNFYNRISVSADAFTVEERSYQPEGGGFKAFREVRYEQVIRL